MLTDIAHCIISVMKETEGNGVGRLMEASGAITLINNCFSLLRWAIIKPFLYLLLSLNFSKGGQIVLVGLPKVNVTSIVSSMILCVLHDIMCPPWYYVLHDIMCPPWYYVSSMILCPPWYCVLHDIMCPPWYYVSSMILYTQQFDFVSIIIIVKVITAKLRDLLPSP